MALAAKAMVAVAVARAAAGWARAAAGWARAAVARARAAAGWARAVAAVVRARAAAGRGSLWNLFLSFLVLTPCLFCNACNCYRIVNVQQPWNTSLRQITRAHVEARLCGAPLDHCDQCPRIEDDKEVVTGQHAISACGLSDLQTRPRK
jgi:hypothetical protein